MDSIDQAFEKERIARNVAERAGWQVEFVDDMGWFAVSPEGRRISYHRQLGYEHRADAWDYAAWIVVTGKESKAALPVYRAATSTNTAWRGDPGADCG
jgi:hypothetical protein